MLERSLSSSLYHWVEHEFPTNFLGKCYQLNWKQPLRGLSNIFLKTGRNLKIQFSTFEGLNTSLFCNFLLQILLILETEGLQTAYLKSEDSKYAWPCFRRAGSPIMAI